jgi:hypothetical protein
MLSCPLCFHDNSNYQPFHVTQLDCDVYIAFNIATISLRGTYQNITPYSTSGTFQIPLLSSSSSHELTVTSCNLYYNNKHFVTSVIDPTIVDIKKNISSSSPSSNDIPFNPNVYTVPFTDCPPNSPIVVDVTYIQQLSFTASGSYQLTIPLTIPPQHCPQHFQCYSNIQCVLDSGTPSCQYQCTSHPMAVTEQNTPFAYANNPYSLSGTAAVALRSPPVPFQQSTDFVFNYLGYGAIGIGGTCLLEAPSFAGNGSTVSQFPTPTSFLSSCSSLSQFVRGTLSCISLPQSLIPTPSLEGTWSTSPSLPPSLLTSLSPPLPSLALARSSYWITLEA